MVRAADALAAAGHLVRLVSVQYVEWASALDAELVKRRVWQWMPIDVSRAAHQVRSRFISARQRVARVSVQAFGQSVGHFVITRAYARTHGELVAAIGSEPFDLVYGGTSGALAATAAAACRMRRPYALDFEDFHPEESEEPDAPLTHALAARVVRRVTAGAAFTTAASAPMAAEYARRFGINPFVVHNVVSRPAKAPALRNDGSPLKLYWFSQSIGPKRGLEDVVRGVGLAQIPAELHLRGTARPEYVRALEALSREQRAALNIIVHTPGVPDDMVDLCAPYDIGLSLEQEGVLNRALCLPNKPLTYLAAGLAVIATETPGQRTLHEATGEGIWWYRPGDVSRLAEGLRYWHADRVALLRARERCFMAARERFHWEHELESGALVAAVRDVLM